MLQTMQQAASTPAPPPTAASFASLLAALASPAPTAESSWNDEDLGDDVATLSYERALSSHARYRPDSRAALADEPEAASSARIGDAAASESASAGESAAPRSFSAAHALAEAEMARRAAKPAAASTAFERNLKSASITIRMSKAECEQLHQRAAEAGLTVSAYLRSCTFEAEALRAQVKETLAELRKATAVGKKTPTVPARGPKRNWFGWMRNLLPQPRHDRRALEA
jgi:predicted DNA binding CopG/RHH family protein